MYKTQTNKQKVEVGNFSASKYLRLVILLMKSPSIIWRSPLLWVATVAIALLVSVTSVRILVLRTSVTVRRRLLVLGIRGIATTVMIIRLILRSLVLRALLVLLAWRLVLIWIWVLVLVLHHIVVVSLVHQKGGKKKN